MRVLSLASLLFLATSAPVLAAPVSLGPAHVLNARKSAGLSIPESSGSSALSKIATGASVASGVLPFIESAFDHFFGGSNSTRRDLETFQALLARADDVDSEAISLKTLGKGLSFGLPVISGLASLFGGSSGNSTRREMLEVFARDNSTDQSDAISLSSIIGVGEDIISAIEGLFGGGSSSSNSTSQKRELYELLARSNITDESGALNLGSIFKIGTSLLGDVESLFGGSSSSNQQQRSFVPGRIGTVKLPSKFGTTALETSTSKRDAPSQVPALNSTASGAISFGDIVGDIGSVLGLFLRRDGTTQPFASNSTASGAINVGDILGDIGSVLGLFLKRDSATQPTSTSVSSGAISFQDIISGISSVLGSILKRSTDEQKRELLRLLARDNASSDVDDSAAFSLSSIFNIGKIIGDGVSIVGDLFGGSGNSTRRDFVELLVRDDSSEALSFKLPTLDQAANIGRIASDAVGVFTGLFGGDGNSTRRDFLELITRDTDTDDESSGALKLNLGDIANIGSIASSAVSVIEGLFGGHGNSTRRAELIEMLAREIQ